MHEVSLVIGLVGQLEAIAREHQARSVRRFVLQVGALSNVVPELLRDAVEVVKEDVPLIRDAECVIEEVHLRLHCRACGRTTEPESFTFGCPACGSVEVEVQEGEQLLLMQVELEIDDAAQESEEDRPGDPD